MSSLLGGGKKQKSTSSTVVDLPEWIQSPIQNIISRGEHLSNIPYENYDGQRIAGFSPDELQAFQNIRGLTNSPVDLSRSKQITGEVARRGLEGFSQAELQPYMNPYIENVLDVGRRRQFENYDQTKSRMMQAQGQRGAFGGSRSGLESAQLSQDFQQQMQDFDTQGLYNSYNEGMNRAMQGTQLAGQSSMDLANITNMERANSLQNYQALMASGGQQRAFDQAGLDINYEDFLKEKAYPYEQLQFLSGLAYPAGQLTAGSTTNTVSKQSGGGSGILGAALGIGSMAMGIPGIGSMLGGGMGSLAGSFGMGLSGMSSIGSMLGGYGSSAGQSFLQNGFNSMGLPQNFGRIAGYKEGGQVKVGERGTSDLSDFDIMDGFVSYNGKYYPLNSQAAKMLERKDKEELRVQNKRVEWSPLEQVMLALSGQPAWKHPRKPRPKEDIPTNFGPGYADGGQVGIGGKLSNFMKFMELWNDGDQSEALGLLPALKDNGYTVEQDQETYPGGPTQIDLRDMWEAMDNGSIPLPQDQDEGSPKGLDDVDLLARTILGEGRGEDIKGKAAIASVIKNRASKRKQGIADVILEPEQFSAWNANDPNRKYMMSLDPKSKDYQEARAIAELVLTGQVPDVTKGATHYVNPETASKSSLEWRNKLKGVGDIGNHRFYTSPTGYKEGGKVLKAGPLLLTEAQRKAYAEGKLNPWVDISTGDVADSYTRMNKYFGDKVKSRGQFADSLASQPYFEPQPGDPMIGRAGLGALNAGVAGLRGLGSVLNAPEDVTRAMKEFIKNPKYTGEETMRPGAEKTINSMDKAKAFHAAQGNYLNANRPVPQGIEQAGPQQPATNPETQAQIAQLIQAMHGSNYAAPAQQQEAPKKEGVNKPLMMFGAALLGSEDGFFKALGQAGSAYVSTADAEEEKLRKHALDTAELEMNQLRTAMYGRSIDAQLAKANNPWTQRLQELKAQDLENKIKNGSYGKTRDMIFKSIMDNAAATGSEINPDDALKEASRLAISASVAGNNDEGDTADIEGNVESAIVDYLDYFPQE